MCYLDVAYVYLFVELKRHVNLFRHAGVFFIHNRKKMLNNYGATAWRMIFLLYVSHQCYLRCLKIYCYVSLL